MRSLNINALLDRNARFWATIFGWRWGPLWVILVSGFIVLHTLALRLVIFLAVIGGSVVLDGLVGADLGWFEYAWLEPIFIFAITLVDYTWFVVGMGICLSCLLAGLSLALQKRSPDEGAP